MGTEELKEKIAVLETELNGLLSKITEEDIKNSSQEEKVKYLELISEIKTKIEILKNI